MRRYWLQFLHCTYAIKSIVLYDSVFCMIASPNRSDLLIKITSLCQLCTAEYRSVLWMVNDIGVDRTLHVTTIIDVLTMLDMFFLNIDQDSLLNQCHTKTGLTDTITFVNFCPHRKPSIATDPEHILNFIFVINV